MLISAEDIRGYILQGRDGGIGKIRDLILNDGDWRVRFAVVDTGDWLERHEVVIAPHHLSAPDLAAETIAVDLDRKTVEESPARDSTHTMSDELAARIHAHYGLPASAAEPAEVAVAEAEAEGTGTRRTILRSAHEVVGYGLHEQDGDLGEVIDLLVDTDGWMIRYMVVDTGRWLPGKQVLIAPSWIEFISWSERKIDVRLTREQVKGSPNYDPMADVDRNFELRLYQYLGYQPYW